MSYGITEYLKSRRFKYKEYYPLANRSAIGIGAMARYFVIPSGIDELVELLRFLYAASVKHRVIGKLSNLLICGDLYDGVIVSTAELTRKYAAESIFAAECGCSMPSLMTYAASLGYGGAEPLATIPGSVGGCVAGNAGAFGVECSDILVSAEIYFPDKDERVHLSASDMRFSYRDSLIKHERAVLLGASFGLVKRTREEVMNTISSIRSQRRLSQPAGARSLGSVFKRVDEIGAGYYIDKAGLKGYSVGGASVSDVHAGFIVNTGAATSSDVLALIELIKEKVFSEFSVSLEEEIEILS